MVAAAVVALGVGAWLMGEGHRRPPSAARPVPTSHAARVAGAEGGAPAPDARRPPALPPPGPGQGAAAGAADAADDGGDELGGDAIEAAWAKVDLEEVRRAMPDNVYWKMSAPTRDEQELERRQRERDHWNDEYGKVLSGTGSDEEIRAYYDQRARLSGDYVEFTTYLLDHYGEVLPERDVSLLKLARRLHLARLEEIPRSLEQALLRKDEQDAARARWQADERAFNAGDGAAANDDGSR